MSTQLVPLGPQAIEAGGLGLSGRLFKLKPATLELVQPTSQQEGAIPGKFRVTATNQHYDELHVVMLFEPTEQRAYFEGSEFSKDSKLCFSTDNVRPHDKAKIAQAMVCAGCPKGDWTKYRKTKVREDMPKCRNFYNVVLADRLTQLPYYLNVRGISIKPFETAMQSVARLIAMMQAAGQKPNIFDVSFKMYPVLVKPYYVMGFKDFAPLAEDKRADFGALFLDFANRRQQGLVQDAVESEAVAEEAAVNAAVTEAPAGVVSGTVVGPQDTITI